jgi:small multidrug resistance pump
MDAVSCWVFLMIAIVFGVMGTVSLKLSHGLQKLKPTLCLLVFYSIAFVLMTIALKGIDMSIAYAVWSGVGTILVTIFGAIVFKEKLTVKKVISLILIIAGVVGIHLQYGIH